MKALNFLCMVPMLILASDRSLADDDGPTPQTPTAFETRNTGRVVEDEANLRTNKKPRSTKVTFKSLTDIRAWRDANGKVIRGRLLAFEGGADRPDTVIRNGKVRLLADGAKAFSLLPLAKLSEEDQVFVKNLAAVRKQDSGESR